MNMKQGKVAVMNNKRCDGCWAAARKRQKDGLHDVVNFLPLPGNRLGPGGARDAYTAMSRRLALLLCRSCLRGCSCPPSPAAAPLPPLSCAAASFALPPSSSSSSITSCSVAGPATDQEGSSEATVPLAGHGASPLGVQRGQRSWQPYSLQALLRRRAGKQGGWCLTRGQPGAAVAAQALLLHRLHPLLLCTPQHKAAMRGSGL